MFTNTQIDVEALPKVENLDLKSIQKSYFYVLIINCCMTYVAVIGCLWATNFFIEDSSFRFTLRWFVVLLFITFLIHLVFLKLEFNNRKYALREKDIVFSRGFIQLSIVILPFNRVQHVEISKSFLERKFNLATLKIYSAGNSGSDLVIRGLSEKQAHSINTYLTTLLNGSI